MIKYFYAKSAYQTSFYLYCQEEGQDAREIGYVYTEETARAIVGSLEVREELAALVDEAKHQVITDPNTIRNLTHE